MLIRGEPWSPADHKHYPPAFQAAVRTLLLAHRRARGGSPAARGTARATARQAAAESEVSCCKVGGLAGWTASGLRQCL